MYYWNWEDLWWRPKINSGTPKAYRKRRGLLPLSGATISFMRPIVVFLKAVAHYWGSLVTGGALIGIVGTYQGTGHTVPPWVYLTIAAVSVVVAFYKAWQDQFLSVQSLQKRSKETQTEVALQRVDVQVSQSVVNPDDGPPVIGLRVVQPEAGFRRGGIGGSYLTAEFRLRHLGGRLPTSIEVCPIYSAQENYSIHFESLPYLARGAEEVVPFEIWKLDQTPYRKARVLNEWGPLLVEFVRDSILDGAVNLPIIIWFRDGDTPRKRKLRLLFDYSRDKFDIVDEPPPLLDTYYKDLENI